MKFLHPAALGRRPKIDHEILGFSDKVGGSATVRRTFL